MASVERTILFVPLAWLFVVIVLWAIAYSKISKQKDGVRNFIGNGLGMVVILGIISYLIDASYDNCEGFLCGLDGLFYSIVIIGLTAIVWPIVLIVLARKNSTVSIKEMGQEDILDDFK